jgi:hemoglobin/transferrin/lactoferrin receptor protein
MKTFFTVGFFMLLGVHTFGQQQEASDTLVNNLEEVVVSANRWQQSFTEVPFRISTIKPSLVNFQNPQTAADLLGISNYVFIQKSQLGGGSPMIRGFATNRISIVVDGVRMNNAIFRSGNVQNVISLDPNSMHQTEVIFGPGAVMYGSDAIGGVMNFQTLQPQFRQGDQTVFKVNAMGRYSSANNENTGHVDFNIGLKKWAFVTSITRSVFDNLKMGSKGPDEYTRPDYVVRQGGADVIVINDDPNVQVSSGYDQWNAMQKISFKPGKSTTFEYGFHYSKTSDYPRYDRLILRDGGSLSNAEWYYGPQKWIMHSLQVGHGKSTTLFDKIRMIAALQDYEESRHNRGFGGVRRTDRTESVNAFSMNLDLDKMVSDKVNLFYGAEFITNEVESVGTRQDVNRGEVTPTSTRYPNGSTWQSTAVYANAKIATAEKWIINLGARFSSVYTKATFDNTFFDFQFTEAEFRNSALSGSLGVIFNPTSVTKVYTNLSSGFRAPNVDDIGKVFDSEPGNVVVPNPDLKPEQAYNTELGFVTSIGSSFRFDAAGYYTLLDNAIARGATTFNGQDSIDYDGVYSRVLAQQNISEVWIAGIQFGIDWDLTGQIKLTSAFNYQKGREFDPDTNRDFSPTHVAPSFGATHLVVRVFKFTGDVYANYNGKIAYDDLGLSERADSHLYTKDKNGNPYAPSWMTLNLKLKHEFNSHFSLTTGVENLFDKRYRPYSSGITAPGRNFIVAIRAQF